MERAFIIDLTNKFKVTFQKIDIYDSKLDLLNAEAWNHVSDRIDSNISCQLFDLKKQNKKKHED